MKLHVWEDGHIRAVASAVGFGLLMPMLASAQGEPGTIACQDGSPAIPVEQFRTISGQGTFELWPANFMPADPLGQPLPANRDSTGYSGFERPGRAGGLELFYDLDIVEDSSGTYLYMAYNAGWEIWNIGGAFATAPQLLSQRDGWDGDFRFFESPVTEFYFLIWDIAAINPVGSNATLVAVAADSSSVGLTIWDATSRTNPIQLYQDTAKTGIQVATANIGGRSYAFLGGSNGIHVYDMTRAREVGPCFENTAQAGSLCGGNSNPVWRGRLEPWPWNRARYLDVLETTVSGQTRHFLVVSDAFISTPMRVELREITNAASLPPASTAIREGLDTLTFGVDLFEIGDSYFIGAADFNDVAIYNVTNCITGVGPCNFNDRRATVPTGLTDFSYVQFSESNGRPFLYKSFHSLCSRPPTTTGPDLEFLLDLSNLESGGGVIDIRGEEYLDPNHGSPQRRINYWSSYYDQSTDGLSTVAPHGGRFHGQYFYRGAQTLFDIHEFTGDVPTTATIQATSPDRWLSSPGQPEWVNLSGTCSVGPDTGWAWTAQNAAGTPVADPDPVVDPLGGNQARVRRDLCAADNYPAGTCPSETLEVEADVSCDGTLVTSNELDLTLADPRPFFDSIDIVEPPEAPGPPPEYSVCQVLNFRALDGAVNAIGGKDLTGFNWTVVPAVGGKPLNCNAGGGGTGLTCSETLLTWNTENVELGDPTLIFTDGFESGDITAWDTGSSALDGTTGITFDVTLTATNEHAAIAQTTQLTLTPLDNLAFLGDGFTIPATPPVDGIYDFTATAQSATLFRWEFEQDASLPGDPGCTLVTPCEIVTTTSPTVQYQWPDGNVNGANYDVGLEISNCDSGVLPISTVRTVQNVTVITGTAPEITAFRVVTVGTDCVCLGGECICPPGDVDFTVDITGDCDTLSLTWGDGSSSNGLACDLPTYTHNYTTPGTYDLEAEACLGVLCDTQLNLTNISPNLPIPLKIEN